MVTVDVRPGQLDARFRRGNPVVFNLTWPFDLTDRTFAAAVGETALNVAVIGGLLTVTVPAATSQAITRTTEWTLTETTAGLSTVLVTGRLIPSDSGTTNHTVDVTVQVAEVSVAVETLGGSGSVISVNGQVGGVTLTAPDVGAEPAGTVNVAVGAEATTRADADAALAALVTELTDRVAALEALLGGFTSGPPYPGDSVFPSSSIYPLGA